MHLLSTLCISVTTSVLILGCADAAKTVTPETNSANLDPVSTLTAHFDPNSILGTPKIVDCTLSGGQATTCLSITLRAAPASFEIGPWCPRNISDGPDVSGIWLNDGQVYDADGAFIQNLSTFYKDDAWQLFDPVTGKINVTDTQVACEAAARPDVAVEYQNHCVECSMSYFPKDASQTYVIPVSPQKAETISPRVDHGGVGIAFSGARLDAAAPLDAILQAYTIAAFDDCGGHVNPNVGYHIHAVTDCLAQVSIQTDHAGQIGIAMDGYPLHTQFNLDGKEPENLDVCRGHSVDGIGYHYHVNDPGVNAILPCHTGQTGCTLETSDDVCDASAASSRRGPAAGGRAPRPDGG